MKKVRICYWIRYMHKPDNTLYSGIFHSEEERTDFVKLFVVPRGHEILSIWEELI